jgi:hypothetical protein
MATATLRRPSPLRWIAALSAGLVGLVLGSLALGSVLWSRTVAPAIPPLAAVTTPEAFASEGLVGLPEPVARYFAFALTRGQPLLQAARIEHAGEFRGGFEAPWSPFTSVQHFTTDPPAFAWDARIRMAPGMRVHVLDTYRQGRGSMHARLAGLVPVVDEEGTPEMASSALMRYLAEAVWFPTALLPRPGLTWEAVDATSARATLTDSGVSAAVTFHFDTEGRITGVSAERFRDVDGVGVLTPWGGQFRDYREMDGMMIPTEGEVAWTLPEGVLTYWRGRITRAAYTFAR